MKPVAIVIGAIIAIYLTLKIVGTLLSLLPAALLLAGLALIAYTAFRAYDYAKKEEII